MASPLDSNPFADAVLDHYRATDPAALDPYRTFFAAKITARTDVSGIWNYDWVEQSFDRATGVAADANPRRAGGIVSGSPVHPALESNNRKVQVGTFAFLKSKGIVNGQTYYEFAAPAASVDPSSLTDCSGCGWVAGLTDDDCLKFTIQEGLGRCDCGDDGQTATASSETVEVSCAEVPVRTTLAVAFSNLTGDCDDWFTAPTVVYYAGDETWRDTELSDNGIYLFCGELGWECLYVGPGGTAAGALVSESDDPFALVFDFEFDGEPCTGDARLTFTAATTDRSVTLTICEQEYRAEFDAGGCDGPCLTLTTLSGSGTEYTATRDCCGCNYAIFSVGTPAVCTEETDTEAGPCGNVVRIRVEWTCCPIDGWEGPGWYCVAPADGDCETDGETVEMIDGDECNTAIQICSGPYETEEESRIACGDLEQAFDVASDCNLSLMPHYLCLERVDSEGEHVDGPWLLAFTGGSWVGPNDIGGYFTFGCAVFPASPTGWTLSLHEGVPADGITPDPEMDPEAFDITITRATTPPSYWRIRTWVEGLC